MQTRNWEWWQIALRVSPILPLPVLLIFNQQAASPLQHFVIGIAVGLSIGASFVTLASPLWEKKES